MADDRERDLSTDPDNSERSDPGRGPRWGAAGGLLRRDGWPLIGAAVALTFVLAAIGDGLGWLGVALALWVAAVFRIPRRTAGASSGAEVTAPLDGRVVLVEPSVPPPGLEMGVGPVTRIRLAPGWLDSRVVRAPAFGTVTAAPPDGPPPRGWPGILSGDAGRVAARCLSLADGAPLGLVLRAAPMAPGASLDPDLDDRLTAGAPIGTLRLAGVVDVYLPPARAARVVEGQRTVAGETPL
ncbi:MAG: hypothetical protein RID91_14600 [Azospirillaceae bacterium]